LKTLLNRCSYLNAIWCQCKSNKFNFMVNISEVESFTCSTLIPVSMRLSVRVNGVFALSFDENTMRLLLWENCGECFGIYWMNVSIRKLTKIKAILLTLILIVNIMVNSFWSMMWLIFALNSFHLVLLFNNDKILTASVGWIEIIKDDWSFCLCLYVSRCSAPYCVCHHHHFFI
jgi:hypothetical protein